jgi:hypothetical protein
MIRDKLVEVRRGQLRSAIPWSEEDAASRKSLEPALTYRSAHAGVQANSSDLDHVLECSRAVLDRWRAAKVCYLKALDAAKYELAMSTGEPRLLRLALLDRRAHRRYRERVTAAAEAYRPTNDEILDRLAGPDARRLQRTLGVFERAGQKQTRTRPTPGGQASCGDVYVEEGDRRKLTRDRYRAIGRKAVWGLVKPAGEQELWVFRHDVRKTADLPEGRVRPKTPLTASELETELIRRDSLSIEWDEVSCLATELECGSYRHTRTFDDWWDAVTRKSWPSPDERPPDPRPSVDHADRSRRGYGPSSDYGGSYGFGGSY